MASGMGYITFAKTEPHLFSMLFMCDQSRDQRERMERQLQPIIELIARQLGMSADTTRHSICICGSMCTASRR